MYAWLVGGADVTLIAANLKEDEQFKPETGKQRQYDSFLHSNHDRRAAERFQSFHRFAEQPFGLGVAEELQVLLQRHAESEILRA
ncbi:MAG: hypothetical protein M1449_02310, partial [Candidatus Thermoplasmatota archaeon]|nr:hypothetical protein [Candidatus Thermoplasmatota archaeon]